MIVKSSSPTRISLLGGGSDLPEFYKDYGGEVISLAVNLRSHLTLYTEDDLWQTKSAFPQQTDPELCWKILDEFGLGSMHHAVVVSSSDAIIGAGLGTSASFAVALVGALNKMQGLPINRKIIAQIARNVEVEKLGWYGGFQDQLAASYGGFNHLSFGEQVFVTPIEQKILPWLFLTYSGGSRKGHKIQEGFRFLSPEKIENLKAIRSLAVEGLDLLDNPPEFAKLIVKSWEFKKQSNAVTTDKIDDFIKFGIETGAEAGKLLGAGGAGYVLFMVSPEKRVLFKKRLGIHGFEETDFELDTQGVDVRIL